MLRSVGLGLLLIGLAEGFSGLGLQVGGGARLRLRSQGAQGLCMQWSPEERDRREAARKEREARILAERAERQRRLEEYDQNFQDMKSTKPAGLDEAAEGDYVMSPGNYGDEAGGLFGWANNNPSSKNAIYDTEFINSAAGGGNVGEMMIGMRGKGKTEESREVKIQGKDGSPLTVYYRQMGELEEGKTPIFVVHGLLDHSWSWRELLQTMSAAGQTCIAPDMVGSGYSSWPQPGYAFDFSEAQVKGVFTQFLDAIGVEKVTLMTQGFVYSQYALLWAMENPDRVEKIVVYNTPLLPGIKLPFDLQQYKLPIVSNFVAQDSMRSERFLEKGSAYALSPEDSDRFREPFLESMLPGLAIVDLMGRFDWDQTLTRVYEGFYSTSIPKLVAWGTEDPYLDAKDAQAFCEATGTEYKEIQGIVGFLPQYDYAESSYNAVKDFLRN